MARWSTPRGLTSRPSPIRTAGRAGRDAAQAAQRSPGTDSQHVERGRRPRWATSSTSWIRAIRSRQRGRFDRTGRRPAALRHQHGNRAAGAVKSPDGVINPQALMARSPAQSGQAPHGARQGRRHGRYARIGQEFLRTWARQHRRTRAGVEGTVRCWRDHQDHRHLPGRAALQRLRPEGGRLIEAQKRRNAAAPEARRPSRRSAAVSKTCRGVARQAARSAWRPDPEGKPHPALRRREGGVEPAGLVRAVGRTEPLLGHPAAPRRADPAGRREAAG